jgi:hypothetical protein
MSKEAYFRELERLLAEDVPYEQAGEMAYDAMRDRLADHADMLRKRKREES